MRVQSSHSALWTVILMLAGAALACNVGSPPITAPPPTLALREPVIGLQPVSGPPGTLVAVGVAGFPTGAKVNLFVAADNNPAVLLAKDLVIAEGGLLNFGLTLPSQIGSVALTRATPLTFTVETVDRTLRASAVFVATGATGTGVIPTVTTFSGAGATVAPVISLYITAPAIGSIHSGASITVTGSGASFNNQVRVQVIDLSRAVWGSATATIQTSIAGGVGPWQVAVAIRQPAGQTQAYIVAQAADAVGQIAQQASIPITLAGAGVITLTPLPSATAPPTLPQVIILTNTPGVAR